MTQFRSPWRFVLLLAAATAFAMPVTSLPVQASVYDANIVSALKLKGSQRAQAQRIISQSRSQRSRVFKRYSINPMPAPISASCSGPPPSSSPSAPVSGRRCRASSTRSAARL